MATPSEKRYIDVPYQVGPGTHPVEIHEALHAAARSNDQPMMRTALDAGADVNKKDQNGCTALHHGVMGDETVRFLLDNAANPNIRDASGGTPLHRAARYPFKGTTETLLQGGADPNIADRSGATPIIEVGNAENVDLLADYRLVKNALALTIATEPECVKNLRLGRAKITGDSLLESMKQHIEAAMT